MWLSLFVSLSVAAVWGLDQHSAREWYTNMRGEEQIMFDTTVHIYSQYIYMKTKMCTILL